MNTKSFTIIFKNKKFRIYNTIHKLPNPSCSHLIREIMQYLTNKIASLK